FSSRRRHTRFKCDWSSDVCSSDLGKMLKKQASAATTLEHLPDSCRRQLTGAISFYSLQLTAHHDSQLDGASKLLFRTAQGRQIEIGRASCRERVEIGAVRESGQT